MKAWKVVFAGISAYYGTWYLSDGQGRSKVKYQAAKVLVDTGFVNTIGEAFKGIRIGRYPLFDKKDVKNWRETSIGSRVFEYVGVE